MDNPAENEADVAFGAMVKCAHAEDCVKLEREGKPHQGSALWVGHRVVITVGGKGILPGER